LTVPAKGTRYTYFDRERRLFTPESSCKGMLIQTFFGGYYGAPLIRCLCSKGWGVSQLSFMHG